MLRLIAIITLNQTILTPNNSSGRHKQRHDNKADPQKLEIDTEEKDSNICKNNEAPITAWQSGKQLVTQRCP